MRRFNALLNWLGTAGVLGIGILIACTGFYLSAIAPAWRELAAQRSAMDQLRTRKLQPVDTASGRILELQRFYSLFPPVGKLTDELDRLYGLAREARLDLTQGEYRLERQGTGLWSYRVVLPIRGTYPQIRSFVDAVLGDMPAASVDALRFERKKVGETMLDAQVRLTLHFQPVEDSDYKVNR